MADVSGIINAIEAAIYTNGAELITGDILQAVLETMVNGLNTLKEDTLTFDNTPTNGSSNPVKSGGVYTALEGKQNNVDLLRFGWIGKKYLAISAGAVDGPAVRLDIDFDGQGVGSLVINTEGGNLVAFYYGTTLASKIAKVSKYTDDNGANWYVVEGASTPSGWSCFMTPFRGQALTVKSESDISAWTEGAVASVIELGAGGGSDGAVRYDVAQALTDLQKAQARSNIGALSVGDLPWKVTIEPDADMAYILIKLGEPSHSCILAIDSASGAGALHGILCVDENFDLTGAVFAGSGGLDTTVDAKSGYDDNSPRNFIVVLKFRNDQPVTLTCIAGNAPQSAEAIDALGGETFTSTRAWTDLEAGGGGGGDEQTSNKKTDIPANRTSETYYPNTKGVFDLTSKWGVISQTQTWSGSGSQPRTYVMSDLVYGAIPQANIDLFTAAGAEFDTATGYFKLNGLTDISYEEMRVIYEHPIRNASDLINEGIFSVNQRTTLPLSKWGANQSISSSQAFANGSMLEVVDMSTFHNYPLRFTAYASFFIGCAWLREVIGPIRIIGGNATTAIFTNCYSLETVHQSHIERNTTFAQSSALSLASVVYMVENAANTSTITITLHATAYARCQADTTEYTYGGQTYTGILALATAHNITIASA